MSYTDERVNAISQTVGGKAHAWIGELSAEMVRRLRQKGLEVNIINTTPRGDLMCEVYRA